MALGGWDVRLNILHDKAGFMLSRLLGLQKATILLWPHRTFCCEEREEEGEEQEGQWRRVTCRLVSFLHLLEGQGNPCCLLFIFPL